MQNLRNPRQWEDGRKKSRKEEKGIDKRGRIWYSNKAVGAVSTAPQSEMKKTLDSGHKMW